MNIIQAPWEWRKATGGWTHRNDPHNDFFHAYDINNNSACEDHLGLIRSVEPPNEGSALCPDCIEIVRAMPAGRDRRYHGAA